MNPFFSNLIDSFTVSSSRRKLLIILLITIVLFILAYCVGQFLPELIDWERTYRPATLELLSAHSPYNIKSFYNPFWVLFPLIPFALLPAKVGGAILFVVSFCTVIYVAIKMGATPISLIAFLLSFPVFFLLLFGQIDWMVLIGLILPPQFGLFLILVKPQIGLAVAIFWLVEAWRNGGIKQVIWTFSPVVLGFILSFLIFGNYLTNIPLNLESAKANFSLWPESIPIGLIFLIFSLRNRRKDFSMIAGPFFSPYVAPHSWSSALLGILPMQWESCAASIGTWIVYIISIRS